MPPFTEAMGLDLQESYSSALCISDSGLHRHKIFPERMLGIHQLDECETNNEASKARYVKEFFLALQDLKDRVNYLLESQSHHSSESYSSSPANDACLFSLRHRMPHFLKSSSLLIEHLKQNDASELMVAKLRCSFGMAAAVQFLDTIEYGLTCPARDIFDDRLSGLLEEMARLIDHDAYFTFRVSHWAAPSRRLAFDLPVCKAVTFELQNDFPLFVTVEPLIMYPAEDLLNVCKKLPKPRICYVEVEQCKHSPLESAEGAGVVGTAYVKVRLTPLHGNTEHSSDDHSWASQLDLETIIIKEARV
jgi:hypothetical protein